MTRLLTRAVLSGLILASLLNATSVSAEEGWYVGGRIEWIKLHQSGAKFFRETTTSTTGAVEVPGLAILLPQTTQTVVDLFNNDTDESIGGSIQVGYDFAGPFRMDLEYRQLSNSIDRIRQRNGGEAQITDKTSAAQVLVANLWYDLFRWRDFVPYVGAGIGAAKVELGKSEDEVAVTQAGFGLNWYVNPRLAIDVNYRWLLAQDPAFDFDGASITSHYEAESAGLGLRYNFYDVSTSQDADGDGVKDSRDQCPHTPRGTKVNARGCSADADNDGVGDARDKCPNTPRGAVVDTRGCPLDDDKDSVYNGLDLCPETPPYTKVNSVGCSGFRDADGDGLHDGADMCPNTPKAVEALSNGCAVTQRAILQGVNFAYNSSDLTESATEILAGVAVSVIEALEGKPGLQIEIQGHTDSAGSEDYNMRLSQMRAEAVRRFLTGAGVNPRGLRAAGYGETKPITSNDTAEGRATNRRVELRFYR